MSTLRDEATRIYRKHAHAFPDLVATPACAIDAMLEFAALAQPEPVAGWRPIETAPTVGEFLVYMPDEIQKMQTARFRENVKVIGGHFAFDLTKPTHWMPLPPAPGAAPAISLPPAADHRIGLPHSANMMDKDGVESLVQIDPRTREGKPPCGECHLQPGERCDICGAVAP